jgi:3-deoxy-D-manno-octulosonate 8-phosphate phosphatase (KDO 8-P phosphatase)
MTPTERLTTDLLYRQAPDAVRAKAEWIELLVLDVDGVLTDGSIWYSDRGDELKRFHVRDGQGLKMWQKAGGRVAVLSGRRSDTVARRAAELGLHPVFQGYDDKGAGLDALLAEVGLPPDRVCGVGDDLPDLPFLTRCGLAVAVGDAAAEVRTAADHVTTAPGGQGAVREAVEWLLKVRGQWAALVDRYRVSG